MAPQKDDIKYNHLDLDPYEDPIDYLWNRQLFMEKLEVWSPASDEAIPASQKGKGKQVVNTGDQVLKWSGLPIDDLGVLLEDEEYEKWVQMQARFSCLHTTFPSPVLSPCRVALEDMRDLFGQDRALKVLNDALQPMDKRRNSISASLPEMYTISAYERSILYDLRFYDVLNITVAACCIEACLALDTYRQRKRSRDLGRESMSPGFARLNHVTRSGLSWENHRLDVYRLAFRETFQCFSDRWRAMVSCSGISQARLSKVAMRSQRCLAEASQRAMVHQICDALVFVTKWLEEAYPNGFLPVGEERDEDEHWGQDVNRVCSLLNIQKRWPRSWR